MTEHAAVVFVFFFLAEYGSIVLMCILTSLLFLGGYLALDFSFIIPFVEYLAFELFFITPYDFILVLNFIVDDLMNTPTLEGLVYGLSLGLKSSMMVFTFI
jgi:NADH-ubiquinone oxidoreductase chain 1